ncbi:putative carboxylesterase 18 [Bidens hawaiensis]|uniref:putative carboxylesterase 18 n=1 Tax=Bidens hawaiensis TaxID=980011 RepID=UPI00404A57B6
MESSAAAETPKSQLSLPLRTRIVLSAIDLAIDPLLRDDGTVPRGLLNLVDFQIPALSIPVNGVKTHDVMVDPTRNLWFRVFVPTQYAEEDLPVMVYFHGGGYIFLSPDVVIGLVAIQPFLGGEERTDSEIRMDGSVPLVTMKRTDWFWNAFMPLGEPFNRDHPIINVTGPMPWTYPKWIFPRQWWSRLGLIPSGTDI